MRELYIVECSLMGAYDDEDDTFLYEGLPIYINRRFA